MPAAETATLTDAPQQPDAMVRAARAAALAGLLGLIVLGLAWELWLAPTGSGTLAIKVLPLALCVLGLGAATAALAAAASVRLRHAPPALGPNSILVAVLM